MKFDRIPSRVFKAIVGNGENLECLEVIQNILVHIHQHQFDIDL